MIEVGDLVVGKSLAGLGLVILRCNKPEYLWVYWMTGKYKNKRTMEWNKLLLKFNGGEHGTYLLDWS